MERVGVPYNFESCAGLISMPSRISSPPTPHSASNEKETEFKLQYYFICVVVCSNPDCSNGTCLFRPGGVSLFHRLQKKRPSILCQNSISNVLSHTQIADLILYFRQIYNPNRELFGVSVVKCSALNTC